MRISGRIRRPIGVRIVRTCANTNSTTGQPSMARFESVTRIGIWPCDLPERNVRWPALAASNAMSAPECDRPTTRTGPSPSWAGLWYSCECSCRIDGSSSAANGGTFGFRNGPVATMTWRAASRPPSAVDTTNPASTGSTRSTRVPLADGQVEPSGVRLEIVGHLATRRPVGRWRREAHARERVVAGRTVESERVPAIPPVVADARVGVEDQERQSAPGQVIAGGQAGLACADDDRVDPLGCLCAVHGRGPFEFLVRRRPGRLVATPDATGRISRGASAVVPNLCRGRRGYRRLRRGRARTRTPLLRPGSTRRAWCRCC